MTRTFVIAQKVFELYFQKYPVRRDVKHSMLDTNFAPDQWSNPEMNVISLLTLIYKIFLGLHWKNISLLRLLLSNKVRWIHKEITVDLSAAAKLT